MWLLRPRIRRRPLYTQYFVTFCELLTIVSSQFPCPVLLQVNGKRLLGLTHVEVVAILKQLPQHVRIVCAHRKPAQLTDFAYAQTQIFQAPGSTAPAQGGATTTTHSAADRLVKAKSDQSLAVTTDTSALNKTKSRSLEPLTGLAMWSTEPVEIELQKGERGLGFSILDYQVSPIMITLRPSMATHRISCHGISDTLASSQSHGILAIDTIVASLELLILQDVTFVIFPGFCLSHLVVTTRCCRDAVQK